MSANRSPIQSPAPADAYRWIPNGTDFKAKLLEALDDARLSIRLETYIYNDDVMGREVLDRLAAAARRGVTVRVLVDAVGSLGLAASFWRPLTDAGGQARVFNQINPRRLPVRNHRKLLVVDDEVAGVGGFNVADEYTGDGVTSGWADLGMALRGPAVAGLARSFDRVFDDVAVTQPSAFIARISRGVRPPAEIVSPTTQLLFSGPGRRASAFQRALRDDVEAAKEVRCVSAYFLPTFTMRRLLRRKARAGVRVQILVPGKSDVPLSQRAARQLYQHLMRAGVEIYEYQPQILHAKLFLAGGAAYVGSANLDTRSLHINVELMVRVTDPETVAKGHAIVDALLTHSKRIDPVTWPHSRSWFEKMREQLAFWLLSRVDPYVARWLLLGPR